MECDNLPTVDVDSNPDPLFVGFLTDEALHLIDFGFKRTDDQFLHLRFDLEVQVIGQLIIEINHENQQPAKTHAFHSTDPPQRYFLQKQFSYSLSLGGGNENLLRIKDELSTTLFTTVVLFAIVNMTILFGRSAVTGGAMDVHALSPCYLGDIKEDNQNWSMCQLHL